MIEVTALNLEDAKIIESIGGDRIKLVSAIKEGGVTPSYGLIEKIVNSVDIPINVAVKPYSNSFVYSEFDMEVLLRDIEIIKNLGVKYISFGSLNENNSINISQLERVIETSKNMNIVFNNTIDYFSNTIDDIEDLFVNIERLKNYENIENISICTSKNKLIDDISFVNKISNIIGTEKVLLDCGLDLYNIENIKKQTNVTNFTFGNSIRIDKSPFNKIDEYRLNSIISKLK